LFLNKKPFKTPIKIKKQKKKHETGKAIVEN